MLCVRQIFKPEVIQPFGTAFVCALTNMTKNSGLYSTWKKAQWHYKGVLPDKR
jgi:hypothetical protein